MTTRYNASCADLLGKIVKRPHHTDQEFHARILDWVQRIVSVQRLGALTRMNFNRGETAYHIARAMRYENIVCDIDNEVVVNECGCARRMLEEAVARTQSFNTVEDGRLCRSLDI